MESGNDLRSPIATSGRISESALQQMAHGAVVVGLDDSTFAHEVALYGLREGVRRGAPVVMVAAGLDPARSASSVAVPFDAEAIENDVLDHAMRVATSAREAGHDIGATPIHVVAQLGPVAEVLVGASRRAAALVVGHRGRGELASRFVGSVGLSCVIHAHCTVIVVRSESVDADLGDSA